MTFKEYQQQAERTCPSLGSVELDLCHMVLGINTEIDELQNRKDDVNAREECADVIWYVANYCRMRNIDFVTLCERVVDYRLKPTVFGKPFSENILKLFNFSAELQDMIKKNIAYGKEIYNVYELNWIEHIVHYCFILITESYHNYGNVKPNILTTLNNNIEKLKVRFPDKFTTENALERDLESERKELEK